MVVKSAFEKRLKSLASSMRKRMTPEEYKLWTKCLRDYRPKYRRQQILEGFIADFYCPAAKLAIEIDGSQHYSDAGRTYDQWRSSLIERNGISVLRFSNGDVRYRFDGVRIVIDRITKERMREFANNM